jgi:CheY-like chemotaxis protein
VPPVVVDRTRIRQVLLNLVSNAAKFTDQGTIGIRTELRDGFVVIHIKDSGVGIQREHLSLIFEEFRQVDSSSNRRFEGTGLGLSICRRLVELHGGQIWVESAVGQGSTFSFSLPTEMQPVQYTPATPMLSETTEYSTGIPILVVDNDQSAIDIVRHYLAQEGYAVRGVKDSRRVLEVAREMRPSAIILDVLMPHKDGWEVLAELKHDPILKDTPVIIYTIIEEQQLGFHLGANAYLTKPIDQQQLLATVAKLTERESHIVVIDDDPDALKIVTSYLAKHRGYHITTACGGSEGLRSIQQNRPDLIILDLMMPEIDGFAVLEELNGNPLTADIPVIVLTAKDLTEPERALLNARVQQLLIKAQAPADQVVGHVVELLALARGQAINALKN